jgi:hypothetical protein
MDQRVRAKYGGYKQREPNTKKIPSPKELFAVSPHNQL